MILLRSRTRTEPGGPCGQMPAGLAAIFWVGFICVCNIIFSYVATNKAMPPTTATNNSHQQQPPTTATNNSRQQQPPTTAANNSRQQQPPTTAANNSINSSTRTTRPPYVAPTSSELRKHNPFGHFLMHIPKSGTSHAFYEINRIVWQSKDDPQFKKMRVCNEAVKRIGARFRKSYKGVECNLWMTEQPFSNKPERVYAILRSPHSHTLSMYFHCKESKDHARRAHKMPPSLDDWLKGWVDVKRNANSSVSTIEEQHGLNRKWQCYNPINFQTRWIGHPQPNIEKISKDVFYPSHSNATATSASGEHQQYQVSSKDLWERYLVLGDQAQMDKSICMIYTHYRGYVAEHCDCTNSTAVADVDDGNAGIYLNQSKVFDHGVSHHGDTYKTTPEQDAMIEFLRDRDMVLFEKTQKIFAEQVRQMEEKYGVKICDKMKIIKND